MQPRINIFVDASLTALGGVGGYIYYVNEIAIFDKLGFRINHWEAINFLVALHTFYKFIQGKNVTIYCENQTAVNSLTSGRGVDPVLHSIVQNLYRLDSIVNSMSHILKEN
jgi:hypothetical protein